ncbi:MAG: succinyl-diaminopimelate desuccinylase [Myxococcota bacterium]|nr:succinyl-diaminopimelate desuccinylase [Myxococcota bacterium]MDW8360976.1 succinyl-diaminopimelate desuccinylase [Myxococcales bacterium]
MTDVEPEGALVRTLLDLVSIPSPTGEERALCDHVEARLTRTLPDAERWRIGDSLVVRLPASAAGAPAIGLVGHLDVVRTEHDGPPRLEGQRLFGPGAADMKSGLAVMIELAERLPHEPRGCEIWLVFYAREEGPYAENALGPLLETLEPLRKLSFAICLEPSDNKLQLGCMGSLHATVRFRGRTAHSARPWQGENAIVKAAPLLEAMGRLAPRDVHLDGLCFREVLAPTLARGGRGRNIVPDLFEINVNVRFAPGRKAEEVFDELRDWIGPQAECELVDASPAARPHADHPFVRRLVGCGISTVEPKQAWTDVARFDAIGVPAVNFGPGTQAQAHQRNEWTEVRALVVAHDVLARFVRSFESSSC